MKRQENREKVTSIPAPFIAPGSTVKPTIKEINARKDNNMKIIIIQGMTS